MSEPGSSAPRIRPPRPDRGRLVGGVCAGLSERYRVDATLLRLAFLLLGLASGLGLFIYALLWLSMPREGSSAATLAATARENVLAARAELGRAGPSLRDAWARPGDGPWPRPLGRRWLSISLIAGGAMILLWSFGAFGWLTGPRILGLSAVAIGAAALISLTTDRSRG